MRVAVVGLGLIGGSIARAATRAGHEVVGVDRAPVLRRARRVIVDGAARVARVEADLVVLAAPPDTNVRLLDELAGRDATITDVTSVKRPIVARAAALHLRRFVGGHPVAGRERGGFDASDAELFRGRPWVLTPNARTPAEDVRRIERLVRACGGRSVHMGAAEHDRTMARVSHLPQVVAWALAAAAESARRDVAGGGFRDMTRLAASPRELWRGILGQNRAEVQRALRDFERALARIRREMRA